MILTSLFIFCLIAQPLLSLPINPNVVSGDARFERGPSSLIVYPSDGAIIDWDEFSVSSNESLEFIQTAPNALVINRVVDRPSRLWGQFKGNGNIKLINPHGIFNGGDVQAGSLLFFTLENKDHFFPEKSKAMIVNQGKMRAEVVEIGAFEVQNFGEILAGEKVILSGISTQDPDLSYLIPFEQILSFRMPGPMILNKGLINAPSVVLGSDYIFIQKGGEIDGDIVELGSFSTKIIRVDGVVKGGDVGVWTQGAVIGSGKIIGAYDLKLKPLFQEIDHE